MSETKAFDLSLYTPDKSRVRIAYDLASLSIEAQLESRQLAPNSPEKVFITPFKYVVNFSQGLITCPDYDPNTDIRDLFMSSPEVIKFAEYVLNKDNYTNGSVGAIWISGPEGYPDSRVGVGVGRLTSSSTAEILNYSGLIPDLSSQDCLDLGYWASHFSPQGPRRFASIAELRDTPIFISAPEEGDMLEHIFVSMLHRPDLYTQISSGVADQVFAERLAHANKIAPILAIGLLGVSHEMDFVQLGAWGESTMMNMSGIYMDGLGSGCGALNSQLLRRSSTIPGLPSPRYETLNSSCPQIECPNCHWKPKDSQVADITVGKLKCCPDCSYNPSTRRVSTVQPQYQVTTATHAQESHKPKKTTDFKPTDHSAISEKVYVNETPWVLYFFTPWLAQTSSPQPI